MRTWMSLTMLVLALLTAGGARSSDWARAYAEIGYYRDVEVTPDGKTVIVLGHDGFFRSSDGGATFGKILVGPGMASKIHLDRQGRIWGVRENRLGRVDAAGETWLPITAATDITEVVVDGDVIVAVGDPRVTQGLAEKMFFVSKDGGKTFEPNRWPIDFSLSIALRDGVVSYVTGPAPFTGLAFHGDRINPAQLRRQTLHRIDVNKGYIGKRQLNDGAAVHDGAFDIDDCGTRQRYTVCVCTDTVVPLEGAPKFEYPSASIHVAEVGTTRFLEVGGKYYEVHDGKMTLVAERAATAFYTFAAATNGTLWVVDNGHLYRYRQSWKQVKPT